MLALALYKRSQTLQYPLRNNGKGIIGTATYKRLPIFSHGDYIIVDQHS